VEGAAASAAADIFGAARYRTLESGIGEIRHIALQGGTMLKLDTDTRVDVATSGADRKLGLVRGKLFLEVGGMRGAPFVVKAGDLVMETVRGAFGPRGAPSYADHCASDVRTAGPVAAARPVCGSLNAHARP
jgi:ferric-dicitrate binding protein FerR (iron transport regulator)